MPYAKPNKPKNTNTSSQTPPTATVVSPSSQTETHVPHHGTTMTTLHATAKPRQYLPTVITEMMPMLYSKPIMHPPI
jgi:hypothetical protein